MHLLQQPLFLKLMQNDNSNERHAITMLDKIENG